MKDQSAVLNTGVLGGSEAVGFCRRLILTTSIIAHGLMLLALL